MNMDLIVLAGGLGTRLKSVVSDVPKPMAPVAGRPFLEYVLAQFAGQGFKRTILSLGHMADVVTQHFGTNYRGMELVHEIEHTPLGTGGALRAAMRHCRSPAALVLNGDTFLDLAVQPLENQWRECQRPMIVGCRVEDAARYGRLDIDGTRITGFLEKGACGPGIINTGHYVLPTRIFDGFEHSDPFSFENDFLASRVQLLGFGLALADGLFIDIGIPEDYGRAQSLFASWDR